MEKNNIIYEMKTNDNNIKNKSIYFKSSKLLTKLKKIRSDILNNVGEKYIQRNFHIELISENYYKNNLIKTDLSKKKILLKKYDLN